MDQLIEVISIHIGHEWKQLARQLKFSETDIGAIEYDNRFSLKEQIFQLFHQWKGREGHGSSSRVLLDGVRKARLNGVLQELEMADLTEQEPIQETRIRQAQAIPKQPVQETDTAQPIQERGLTQATQNGKPTLILPADGENNDVVEKDSPEDQKREKIRIKRLARLSSDETGEGPFEEGDMVHVESLGYGVVKWLGFLKLKKDSLIAGVEFDEPVPGGGTGDFDGTRYFTCDPGIGLFLPYHKLKKDGRFESENVTDTPKADTPKTDTPKADTPKTDTPKPDTPKADTPKTDTPKTDTPMTDESKMLGPLIFCVPNDHVGLVIGREGKNILEVERATNTSIKVDSRPVSLGDKKYVKIMGSEENCKRAFLMITQKLQRRVSLHTAASETIKVPDNMVGRIIGKEGVTVQCIKSLSGAHDIKFSERPRGLEAFFGPELERDCVITGSRDEIEEAKKLIKRVLEGEDIVTDARLEALMVKLKSAGLSLDSGCILS